MRLSSGRLAACCASGRSVTPRLGGSSSRLWAAASVAFTRGLKARGARTGCLLLFVATRIVGARVIRKGTLPSINPGCIARANWSKRVLSHAEMLRGCAIVKLSQHSLPDAVASLKLTCAPPASRRPDGCLVFAGGLSAQRPGFAGRLDGKVHAEPAPQRLVFLERRSSTAHTHTRAHCLTGGALVPPISLDEL